MIVTPRITPLLKPLDSQYDVLNTANVFKGESGKEYFRTDFTFSRNLKAGNTVFLTVDNNGKKYVVKRFTKPEKLPVPSPELGSNLSTATLIPYSPEEMVKAEWGLRELLIDDRIVLPIDKGMCITSRFENAEFLAYEYVPGVTMHDLLCKRSVSKDTEEIDELNRFLFSSAYELSRLLTYLSCKRKVYGDLKPENIMIDENGNLKLIDLQGVKDEGETLERMLFTPIFCAPEQIRKGEIINPKMDSYALAGVFYNIVKGKLPIEGSNEEVVERKRSGFSFPRLHSGNEVLNDIIRRASRRKPEDRIPPEEFNRQLRDLLLSGELNDVFWRDLAGKHSSRVGDVSSRNLKTV